MLGGPVQARLTAFGARRPLGHAVHDRGPRDELLERPADVLAQVPEAKRVVFTNEVPRKVVYDQAGHVVPFGKNRAPRIGHLRQAQHALAQANRLSQGTLQELPRRVHRALLAAVQHPNPDVRGPVVQAMPHEAPGRVDDLHQGSIGHFGRGLDLSAKDPGPWGQSIQQKVHSGDFHGKSLPEPRFHCDSAAARRTLFPKPFGPCPNPTNR